jgi:hypothetical protein
LLSAADSTGAMGAWVGDTFSAACRKTPIDENAYREVDLKALQDVLQRKQKRRQAVDGVAGAGVDQELARLDAELRRAAKCEEHMVQDRNTVLTAGDAVGHAIKRHRDGMGTRFGPRAEIF